MISLLQNAVAACWIVFIAFWVIASMRTKRTVERKDLGSRLLYSIPIVAGAWLLLKGTSDPGPLGDRVLPHTVPVLIVGLAITVAGLALALWARVTIGRNWSSDVTFKEGHELIRHGPYAHVRHPIYSALLAMFIGSAIAIGTVGALIGLPIVLLGVWIKLNQEEALMIEHFPAAYASYRSEVRALVPW